ncbi:MAG: BAPKO_0422 family outer member beta-barrel protein [Bradymonadaceae bacterium]
MKIWFQVLALTAMICLVFSTGMPQAQASGPMNRNFGIGLSFGAPTSITGKYYFAGGDAFDFHVGSNHNWYYSNGLFLAGDYLMHIWTFVENSTLKMPFYAGIGGFAAFALGGYNCNRRNRWNCHEPYDFGIGARIPIGTAIQFNTAPFEIYFELSPTLGMYFRDSFTGYRTDVGFHIAPAALGARFYFE